MLALWKDPQGTHTSLHTSIQKMMQLQMRRSKATRYHRPIRLDSLSLNLMTIGLPNIQRLRPQYIMRAQERLLSRLQTGQAHYLRRLSQNLRGKVYHQLQSRAYVRVFLTQSPLSLRRQITLLQFMKSLLSQLRLLQFNLTEARLLLHLSIVNINLLLQLSHQLAKKFLLIERSSKFL